MKRSYSDLFNDVTSRPHPFVDSWFDGALKEETLTPAVARESLHAIFSNTPPTPTPTPLRLTPCVVDPTPIWVKAKHVSSANGLWWSSAPERTLSVGIHTDTNPVPRAIVEGEDHPSKGMLYVIAQKTDHELKYFIRVSHGQAAKIVSTSWMAEYPGVGHVVFAAVDVTNINGFESGVPADLDIRIAIINSRYCSRGDASTIVQTLMVINAFPVFKVRVHKALSA